MLPGIFIQNNRRSNADIQALGPAELWNGQPLNLRIQRRLKAQAKLLVAEDKGTFFEGVQNFVSGDKS